ncbi:3-isopropylmalate dehydrogenase [Dehalococcoides mccartyi]|uniref:3-isopropylmalate dehydrogenase n=1 Tax=Dehalococcoides mccartyi TaxID=61435 RepID=A0A328EQM1_9CHLR|nr:3-isopropylmalate dehydrogenase [Dehalococcoides mccartyi]
MDFKLTVLPGDGIGPEVMDEGLKVLNAVAKNTSTLLNISTDLSAVAV